MLSLGPMPMPAVLVAVALVFAIAVAYALGGARTGSGWRLLASRLTDLLLVGLLAARLAFVLRWWPQYAAEPISILMIHDGGFLPLPGIVGAVAFGIWRTRHDPDIRRPLGIAATAGLAVWLVASNAVRVLQQDRLTIPDAPLVTLEGTSRQLTEWKGQPLVINLWACWCPPCRREMPVLASAQDRHPEVQFVFVNQGEAGAVVREYLERSGIEIEQVLLDADTAVGRSIRTRGLPATLFFDAEGRLVQTHLGPVSTASLSAKVASIRSQ